MISPELSSSAGVTWITCVRLLVQPPLLSLLRADYNENP